MLNEWITPGLIIAVFFGLWRFIAFELKNTRSELGSKIDHLHERIDHHLDNHPTK